jgi:hypothetical protein
LYDVSDDDNENSFHYSLLWMSPPNYFPPTVFVEYVHSHYYAYGRMECLISDRRNRPHANMLKYYVAKAQQTNFCTKAKLHNALHLK